MRWIAIVILILILCYVGFQTEWFRDLIEGIINHFN